VRAVERQVKEVATVMYRRCWTGNDCMAYVNVAKAC